MINIKRLIKSDKGRWVEYKPSHGAVEKGRIKSWNDKWIFVVYNCDDNWDIFVNYTAAATRPDGLNFIPEPTVESEDKMLNFECIDEKESEKVELCFTDHDGDESVKILITKITAMEIAKEMYRRFSYNAQKGKQ